MIHADYLFLLTDVDGLYTSNPRKDPNAKQIEVVTSIAAIRAEVSTTTLGSSLGTGGMETKLIAAEISTAAGVTTIITSSKHPENIFNIIEYGMKKEGSNIARPPHTLFTASSEPVRDLRLWTSHTLNPSGTVIIDAGAHHVLSKRESGGRLLAAGVIGVIGAFASQQAVRIVVRRRQIGQEEREEEKKAYMRALESTRPSSPVTAASLAEDSETEFGLAGVKAEDGDVSNEGEFRESDVIEIGRGLANYNSAQIMAVKGLNRYVLLV